MYRWGFTGNGRNGPPFALSASVSSLTRGFWTNCRGFSVAEVTTVLTALSILSAAAAPSVSEYVEEAKLIRARQDVRAVALGVVRLMDDVGPERKIEQGWASYDLLVGNGLVPAASGADSQAWTSVDAKTVDALDDHLITNAAGYTQRRRGAMLGWRGAYLQQSIQSDPWGNRYAVNIRAMKSDHFDTLALSAGPNGIVESGFEVDGLTTQGDDIFALVATSGLGSD
jgi:type II secretory pathway pseudopilin PulG